MREPFAVLDFHPRTQVTAYTWRGEQYDLTGSLIGWNTTKAITSPAGTFTIDLTDTKNARRQTWQDRLMPMDHIEIRATAGNAAAPYPVIMRGFIDSIQSNFSMGPTGGPIEPRITITGRDYTKLFLINQILYLYGKGLNENQTLALASATTQTTPGGLVFYFGGKFEPFTVYRMFDTLFNATFSKIYKHLQQYPFPYLPPLITHNHYPDYHVSLLQIPNYNGSIWNLFAYFNSAPFGELFIYDDETPQIMARITPYKTFAGQIPTLGQSLPSTYFTPQLIISNPLRQSSSLTKSDADQYTYFFTYSDNAPAQQQGGFTLADFSVSPGNAVYTANRYLYGLSPLLVSSPWVNVQFNPGNTNTTNGALIADTMNRWLTEVMENNAQLLSGSFTFPGNERLKIGQYFVHKEMGMEFYITAVSHAYKQYQAWQTTVSVARGRPLQLSELNHLQQAAIYIKE